MTCQIPWIFHKFLTFVAECICILSDSEDDSNGLEEAQKNQRKAGAAGNDTETTGLADSLREEAAEMIEENNDENDLL